MAKIIYKENCKSKNIIECIEGIEIELLNGQKALIYPKYSEKMLLPTYKIASWNAKEISEIDALKKEYSHLATEELLRCGSPAAEHVSNFHSDKYGVFNLPTLLAAMETAGKSKERTCFMISSVVLGLVHGTTRTLVGLRVATMVLPAVTTCQAEGGIS